MSSHRLAAFGTSVFSQMSALARDHDAINLSQGFPDFEGPPELLDLAEAALREGHNQYAPSTGHPELVSALAEATRQRYGLDYDPAGETSVFCGATEALAAAVLGLAGPGDEILLVEPFYDSYPALVALAGAEARYLTLRFPDFALDLEALDAAISPRTRAILLNTPHNPSGKVFDRAELEALAERCRRHDLIVIADEVYEHLTFDDARHQSIAELPGMRQRTLRISSFGKSFSMTGWKVGWAQGPPELVAAAQSAHQFLTFCTAAPMQVAAGRAIRHFGQDYFETLRRDYTARRKILLEGLQQAGFAAAAPQGTYFVLADFSALWEGDDRSFAEHLVREAGVATIPPSSFYARDRAEGQHLLRFAFCKRRETLERAMERLARNVRAGAG